MAALAVSALHTAHAATAPVTIQLTAENSSGQNGTATLTDLGNGKTMVDVAITGEPDGASEPMHVHTGQCGPTLGKVVYPLTNLESGKSSTTIDTALDALMTGGFAINGHKSAAEIGVYYFCGNIPAAATAAGATGTPAAGDTTTPAATTASDTTTPVAAAASDTSTPAAASGSGTAAATPAAVIPTTGGTPGSDWLLPVAVLGILVVAAGFVLKRTAR